MSNSKLYTDDVRYVNRLDSLRANFQIFTLKKYQLANSSPHKKKKNVSKYN